MANPVVESYSRSREEDRLTTNNARRIEFLTTVRALDELLPPAGRVLDCAAGTGIYAFHLAEKGYEVAATDITPRHVELIRDALQEKPYTMQTAVADATDLSLFSDDSFDAVLNMGPFYHLTEASQREKCLRECLRVLRPGGLLLTAYIPRFFVFQYVALADSRYLNARLADRLIQTGVVRHDDEDCFWTDTYYSTKAEMESLYRQFGLEIVDHFAQDGIAPLMKEKIDAWNEAQFAVWCDHHYSVCREESLLGASNHVIIAGKKTR